MLRKEEGHFQSFLRSLKPSHGPLTTILPLPRLVFHHCRRSWPQGRAQTKAVEISLTLGLSHCRRSRIEAANSFVSYCNPETERLGPRSPISPSSYPFTDRPSLSLTCMCLLITHFESCTATTRILGRSNFAWNLLYMCKDLPIRLSASCLRHAEWLSYSLICFSLDAFK